MEANPYQSLLDLVPALFALGIASIGVGIAAGAMAKMFLEEERIQMLELALVGVVKVEKHDKNKTTIEYHYKDGINSYIKNFLRRNPKWTLQIDEFTGKYKLTRIYRRYYKKQEGEGCCPECGRSLEDWD